MITTIKAMSDKGVFVGTDANGTFCVFRSDSADEELKLGDRVQEDLTEQRELAPGGKT